jgi:hypothetical protein
LASLRPWIKNPITKKKKKKKKEVGRGNCQHPTVRKQWSKAKFTSNLLRWGAPGNTGGLQEHLRGEDAGLGRGRLLSLRAGTAKASANHQLWAEMILEGCGIGIREPHLAPKHWPVVGCRLSLRRESSPWGAPSDWEQCLVGTWLWTACSQRASGQGDPNTHCTSICRAFDSLVLDVEKQEPAPVLREVIGTGFFVELAG